MTTAWRGQTRRSEIIVLGELHGLGVLELGLHLSDLGLVDGDFTWGQNGCLDKGEVGLAILWLGGIDGALT